VIHYPLPNCYLTELIYKTSDQLALDGAVSLLCLAPTKLRPGADNEMEARKKFTFFFGAENENGEFSQWYIKKFQVDDVWYNCAEQYMMHQKAGELKVTLAAV
jgi:hypothetical protein